MKVFTNTTDLAASRLADGQIVQTKGYATAGDGGNASYLIRTAVDFGGTPDGVKDFSLANGNVAERLEVGQYTQGSTGSVTRSVSSKLQDTVSVKDFGAVGDGVTDDTAAINSALSAITTETLYFPKGTYLTDGGHNISGKKIKGDGSGSIVQLSGTNTYDILFKNNPNSLAEAGAYGSGGGGISISDISLKGNWDGSSGQVAITPPSGNGNGLVGLRYADYDIDTNGAVLQLISSTRVYMDNVHISFGYGHNMILYRGGYSYIKKCRFHSTRGSGIYSPNPSASDTVTTTPIESCAFETCRGEYGGIYAQYWSGTSVTNCVFEGQPYGIYLSDVNDLAMTGNYGELSYYDDFYISPGSWGVVDIGNYSYNQVAPSGNYKGLMHYRRDSGLFIDTDNSTYGVREAQINGKYIQRSHTSHGGNQTISAPMADRGDYFISQLSNGGGSSLEWYSVLAHQHTVDSLQGRAEVRFHRNLNQNSWSGIGFATYNGSTLDERMLIDRSGNVTPGANNAQALGSSSLKWNDTYSTKFHANSGSTVFWTSGNGSPEGVTTAGVGSLYTRLDGGAGTTLYVKESGTGNTGWVAK